MEWTDLGFYNKKLCKNLMNVLLIILLFQGLSLSQNATAFTEAADQYNQQNFAESIKKYEKIYSEGFESLELYFNLGTSYFRKGNLGKAILFLEKAAQISPNDKNVKTNLEIARKAVSTEISVIPDFFLMSYWKSLARVFSSTIWAILFLILFSASLGLYSMYLLGKSKEKKKKAFIFASVLLVLSFIFALLGFAKYRLESNDDFGVVMEKQVTLMSAPDDRSEEVFQLSEGVKFEILDNIGNWIKVELSDKEIGWLQKKSVEII